MKYLIVILFLTLAFVAARVSSPVNNLDKNKIRISEGNYKQYARNIIAQSARQNAIIYGFLLGPFLVLLMLDSLVAGTMFLFGCVLPVYIISILSDRKALNNEAKHQK